MQSIANVFSPAQCVGYVSLVLGVLAFLQKSDRRLKFLNGTQGLVYALHFAMLGNMAAAASAVISGTRSLLALKTRSPWLAAFMIALVVAVGAPLVHTLPTSLPIVSSILATIAVFFTRGIPMRLLFLTATLLWLINNIASGSYGGIILESIVAVTNTTTMIRLVLHKRARAAATASTARAAAKPAAAAAE